MELNNLSPFELEKIIEEATHLLNMLSHSTTINSNLADKESPIKICPFCGGKYIVRNGHKNGAQRFLCRNCGKTFGSTHGTFFYRSHVDFSTIMTFITCELNQSTLKMETDYTGLSQTTCFSLRHKLYSSISCLRKDKKLCGETILDPFFKSINLKGTPTAKMPRLSKHRGNTSFSRGISSHKVCIYTAVDENDTIVFEIEGTGPETEEMSESFSKYILNDATLITDMKQAFKAFDVKKHIEIKSSGHVNDEGQSLAEVNQLHSEFNQLYSQSRGISLKHLQGYLDFFTYRKYLKYSIEKMRDKEETLYKKLIKINDYIQVKEIYKVLLPVDVYGVYLNFKGI